MKTTSLMLLGILFTLIGVLNAGATITTNGEVTGAGSIAEQHVKARDLASRNGDLFTQKVGGNKAWSEVQTIVALNVAKDLKVFKEKFEYKKINY